MNLLFILLYVLRNEREESHDLEYCRTLFMISYTSALLRLSRKLAQHRPDVSLGAASVLVTRYIFSQIKNKRLFKIQIFYTEMTIT